MKKIYLLISIILFRHSFKAQDFKLGESFKKYEKEFIIKGISSTSNNKYYQYNKTITKLIYNRVIDRLYVTTQENKITCYIYMLVPKFNDEGVPKDLIMSFEKEMNVKLKLHNGKYGIKGGGLLIQFSREADPETKKDRIMFYTTISN